jgi:hypothetical protein
MKKTFLKLGTLSVLAVPAIAGAQSIGGILGLLAQANDLINRLIPFIIALTVLIFLWGIFKFVIAGGDGEARKEAQGYIIWGVVALFVMVSVWGILLKEGLRCLLKRSALPELEYWGDCMFCC